MPETLPCNLDAERYVLGSILLDYSLYPQVSESLTADDFSLEKHKRILLRMGELHSRGERIDRVTLAEELQRHSQLESVDGLSYIVSLDDGLPSLSNLDGYIRIVHEKTQLRRIIRASETARQMAFAGHYSPQDVLEALGGSLSTIGPGETLKRPIWASELVAESNIGHLLSPTRDATGNLPLPWKDLDRVLCGLQRGQLVLIAGHTSTGKTSLALQIGAHAAEHTGVVYFSLEMEPRRLFRRMVVQRGRVDHDRLRHGIASLEERNAAQAAAAWIESHPIAYDERASTLRGISDAIRRANRKHSVGLVVVDYLQRLRSTTRYSSRAQEVADQSRALKQEAMELGIPIIVLSQFSRESAKAGRNPTRYDLKESGDIENDADTILLLWPDLKQAQTAPVRDVLIHVDKQREGPTGIDVPMEFHAAYQRFEDRE